MNDEIKISWKETVKFVNNIQKVQVLRINYCNMYKFQKNENQYIVIQGFHKNENGQTFVMAVTKRLN